VNRARWSVGALALLAIAVLVVGDIFVARGWIVFHPFAAEGLNWLFTLGLIGLAAYSDSMEGD
jgi:hypothetical protein